MLYCYDKDLPFDYSKSEMALVKKNGNGILYDGQLGTFQDFFGNDVDIKDKIIFPRTGVEQIYEMNQNILEKGGKPIVTNEKIRKIVDWPKYYQTKRKMKTYLGTELIKHNVIEEIEKGFGREFFIKTAKKNFSEIIPISLLKDQKCVFYKALQYHLEDEFIISEPIHICKDSYGIKEYRCFVMNDEPINISRFTTEVFHEIDPLVLERLEEIIASVKEKFSGNYVVDLMEYECNHEKYIDVVEFNPIHGSGLYLYNSVLEKSEDLLHIKNRKRIAKEFLHLYDSCKTEGEVINNRNGNLYNIRNSFSNDLRSIYLTGERGVIFATDVNLTVECFAKDVTSTSLECRLIESDEELFTGWQDNMSEEISTFDEEFGEETKEELAKMKRLLKL